MRAGHIIEAVYIERQLHAPLAAELVHQHPAARVSLDVLKQQRGAAWGILRICLLALLGHSVSDLGDFENGVHRLVDVLQFASFIERLDPGPQVVVCQSGLHDPELRKGLITILSGA